MYNPLLFSSEVLKRLASFMACFPDVPLLAVDDFNNYLDPAWGKLPAPTNTSSPRGGPTPFGRLLDELRLTDVWRIRHQKVLMLLSHLWRVIQDIFVFR